MSFLAPAALIFAAALPVVILFYLLKRRRVVKLTSSTLLWQRFLAETQASSPLQKLRHNWLLLLQLLLLTLVVLALMRPYVKATARESRLRVLILDGSASMQATDISPSRFEHARAEALRWVDGLRDGEQMMVLLAGAATEVKQSPTGNQAALRRALQSCAISDAPTRLADALKTAGAFTTEKRGEETFTSGEIHLFSDGAAPDLESVANRNLPLIYHRIGASDRNAGIVRLEVRANPEDASQRAVFASIGNFSTNPITTEAELLLDGQLLETRPLTLDPTNSQVQIFKTAQGRDGLLTLRLTARDDFAGDNQASVLSLLPAPVKVLLVTRGNRFLEKALRGSPGVLLSVASQLTDPASEFDVCVLDDVIPARWPAINTLALHTAQTNWFPAWSPVQAPPIVDWKSTHPLLRFVNFDNVQIAESLAVKTPVWGVAVVDSPKTPLVVAGELNRQRLVWVGFDPLQSTWPLRISFPIFMANAVEWLNPASAQAGLTALHAGDAFRFPIRQAVTRAEITTPDGRILTAPVDSVARELVFNDTSRQGAYRVKAGTNETVFCVNLLDSNESNIKPRDELPLGKYNAVAATTLKQSSQQLWRWIALAGLAVLMFEGWWYHRRTA